MVSWFLQNEFAFGRQILSLASLWHIFIHSRASHFSYHGYILGYIFGLHKMNPPLGNNRIVLMEVKQIGRVVCDSRFCCGAGLKELEHGKNNFHV